MIEKTIITGLIGVLATLGYADIAENAQPIFQEANVVAASLQQRQLVNALELYHLKNGEYPAVTDQELVATLFRASLLKKDKVVFTIDYTPVSGLQNYELSVS